MCKEHYKTLRPLHLCELCAKQKLCGKHTLRGILLHNYFLSENYSVFCGNFN